MTHFRRLTWLWPLGLVILWLLALPLAVIVYALNDRTQLLPEYQLTVESIGQTATVVLWTMAIALVTIIAYTASFWSARRRRPRTLLVALMLPWSAVLAGWWYGVNGSRLNDFMEMLLMGLFVAGPPAVVLLAEAVLGAVVLRRGMQMFAEGETTGATRLLQMAQLFRPGDREITKTIGLSLFRAREWSQAEEWLIKARQAFPRDVSLSWPLATLALHRRSWEEAIPLLREHLDHEPRDQAAWERLTEAHLALSQLDRAIWALEHLEREDAQHLLRLADLHLRAGGWDKALDLAQRVRALERPPHARFSDLVQRLLSQRPSMVAALEAMAKHAEELGQPEELQRWRERILAERPQDEALRRQVMEHLRQTGQHVNLERHLHVLLSRPEPEQRDMVELVDMLIQRREWSDLAKWIQRAKEIFPDAWEFLLAEAHLALVNREYDRCFQLCHMARARAQQAEAVRRIDAVLARLQRARGEDELEALRRAIAEAADPLPLRWELVDRLMSLRFFEQVVTELDEIIRRHPDQQERFVQTLDELLRENRDNFTLLNYLRDLQMREGALDAVYATSQRMAALSLSPDKMMREICEKLLQINPRHAPSLGWLAAHAHRTQDWGRAVELFDRWFEAEPEAGAKAENIQLLFDALREEKDLARGVEEAGRLLALRHREVENLKALARLYEHHGQLPEAHRCFLRAREIDNQDREIHDAVRTLDEEIRRDRIHEIEVLLEKRPEDTALHHELGDLHYSFQRYTDALPHLQRAAADPRLANLCKAKMAHALAQCGMLDMAHETLSEVVFEGDDPEQLEALKAIHYNVGEIFREEGQAERALQAFKRLFRFDAGYRNVVQKLEKLTQ